ncbi:hypothetical protein PROFUN_01374 [Planoprotostelium fungivorum]|uniref:non-specific serine/threonine protein kinase n=1 Tax=Planoprotostelium fungivorum TaxID=1890364 RepID=A0A2P6NT13_9EUKA|nr:hypothetical protein PROFUN_01374 [Planoprotostelium fungivorum]
MALAAFAVQGQSSLLSNVPIGLLKNGVLTNGILNGLRTRTISPFGGLLGGLLGGKGLVVTAAYSTSVFVHADIAAHIAIDLPTQTGLLSTLSDVCGKVTSTASVLDRVSATTTLLDIKVKADVQVVVGVFADLSIALPSGCSPLHFKDLIFGNVQLGLNIDLSADVEAAATLLSPVLDITPVTEGSVGLLKWNPVDNSYFALPCHFDTASGRAVANLPTSTIADVCTFTECAIFLGGGVNKFCVVDSDEVGYSRKLSQIRVGSTSQHGRSKGPKSLEERGQNHSSSMSSEFEGIPDDDVWNIDFTDLVFEKQIARGSFGKVYKGTYLGIPVAIKSILRHDDPAYIKYVEREISILKGIRHPYIVGFCGVSTDGHGLFIVTEFINGGDIRTMIKNDKLTWGHRVQIASDLAKAIYYLHSKKIIHRDLKSKNLLMGPDQRVRLCDFGFARTTDILGQRAMTICGTPGFVAPEIMMGSGYDGQCDVFSFGNVIAEMITLQRPGKDFWLRNVSDEFQMDIKSIVHLAPRDCPVELLNLCMSCCEYRSTDRPVFLEIIKKLKRMEEQYPMVTPTSPPNEGSYSPAGNNGQFSPAFNSPTMLSQMSSPRNRKTVAEGIAERRVTLTDTESVITDRHLSKMITRATSPDVLDLEYVNDFLMTYPCIAKPIEVLEGLTKRFLQILTPGDEGGDYNEVLKRQKLSIMRVMVFLKGWIEKYVEDFDEEEMQKGASRLRAFALENLPPPEGEMFNIEKMLAKSRSKQPAIREMPKPPNNNRGPDVSIILQTNSLVIAQQITYILQAAFSKISARDFLKETWRTKADCGLAIFMHDAKKIAQVISTCIVKGETKEMRSNLLAKFIDVANGFFCVMQGIQNPGVERLQSAFQMLKLPTNQLLKSFKPMASKDDHYSYYKAKQQDASAPTIPFIEPYLDELNFIDTYYPDIAQGGVIHFAKHRKIGRIVRSLLSYQDTLYTDVPFVANVNNLLHSVASDEDITKLSFQAEAPSSFQY